MIKSGTCSFQTCQFRIGSAVWTFALRQEGNVYSNRGGEAPDLRQEFHVPLEHCYISPLTG